MAFQKKEMTKGVPAEMADQIAAFIAAGKVTKVAIDYPSQRELQKKKAGRTARKY